MCNPKQQGVIPLWNKRRRMSVATRSKQKKVVSILVLITTMFTIVNIPSAISRILSSPEMKKNESFQVHEFC